MGATWIIGGIRTGEVEAARLLLTLAARGRRVELVHFTTPQVNAHAAVVAVDGDRVVGFARVLGDGVSNGYLSVLVVEEGCRGQGIGRALVKHVMGDDPDMTWVLRARGDVREFNEKLGFLASSVVMERARLTDPRADTGMPPQSS